MTEFHETIETPSDRDQAEIDALYDTPQDEATQYNPILKVWREVLAPADTERVKKPTPQWCNKIMAKYMGLEFAGLGSVHNLYFAYITVLRQILDNAIEENPDALKVQTHAEDRVENGKVYLDLLFLWQGQFIAWELDWSHEDPLAAEILAALGEVHAMFFGEMGILPYLNSINFEVTEDDQQALSEYLQGVTESYNSKEAEGE